MHLRRKIAEIILWPMTKKRSSEFLTDEMENFQVLGTESHKGNISVEMCSDGFFLKCALVKTYYVRPIFEIVCKPLRVFGKRASYRLNL